MTNKRTVTLTPKAARARNRIREHGAVMALVSEGFFGGESAVLV